MREDEDTGCGRSRGPGVGEWGRWAREDGEDEDVGCGRAETQGAGRGGQMREDGEAVRGRTVTQGAGGRGRRVRAHSALLTARADSHLPRPPATLQGSAALQETAGFDFMDKLFEL